MSWQLVGSFAGKDISGQVDALSAEIATCRGEIAALQATLLDSVKSLVAEAVGAISIPKDGEDGAAGKDGASVTLDDVAPLVSAEVSKAVAAIPRPKDGEPGPSGESGKSVTVEELAPVVETLVAKAVAAIPPARDGQCGEDGKSVTVDDVAPLVRSEVSKAVAAIPAPKDGADGASVSVADVQPMVQALVKEAVSAIPAPRDGASVTADDIAPLVRREVATAVAALPAPKDGANGKDGASITVDDLSPLIVAEVTKAVESIPRPKDGVGLVGAVIDREGHLVLTLSDGTLKTLGAVVGRDVDLGAVESLIAAEVAKIPRPKDGADGFGFDDLDMETTEDGVYLTFQRGTEVKRFRMPVVYDRGVYREGTEYRKGDAVTWGGSYYVAQKATSAQPGLSSVDSRAWRLTVKRGSDGKVGPPGKDGERGRNGEPGPVMNRY